MGVPKFASIILQRWSAIATAKPRADLPGVSNSSLALDMNGIIHEQFRVILAAHEKLSLEAFEYRLKRSTELTIPWTTAEIVTVPQQLIEGVCQKVLALCKEYVPKDTLIMAVDGVAPMAKMKQQQGRRAKSAQGNPFFYIFDTNAITPGTDFMLLLDQALRRMIDNQRRLLPPRVYYSSHLEPGEGEHKIAQMYREGIVNDPSNVGHTHLLQGLDADLIMISLVSPVRNIVLTKENTDVAIDIEALKQGLMSSSTKAGSIVTDFVLMTFFLGNDFLPASPGMMNLANGLTTMLRVYELLDRPLVINEEINLSSLQQLLTLLAGREGQLLRSIARPSKGNKIRHRIIEENYDPQFANNKGGFKMAEFRQAWYQEELGMREMDLAQILSTKLGLPIPGADLAKVKAMGLNYLAMLHWNLLYYLQGHDAVNFDLFYEHYLAPLLSDLPSLLLTPNITDLLNHYKAGIKSFPDNFPLSQPLTVLHQMVAVLPPRSANLLPSRLQWLMSYDSPILDLYPRDFIYDLEGKDVKHAGSSLLPLLDKSRILAAVSVKAFEEVEVRKYQPVRVLVNNLTDQQIRGLGFNYIFRREPVLTDVGTAKPRLSSIVPVRQEFYPETEVEADEYAAEESVVGEVMPEEFSTVVGQTIVPSEREFSSQAMDFSAEQFSVMSEEDYLRGREETRAREEAEAAVRPSRGVFRGDRGARGSFRGGDRGAFRGGDKGSFRATESTGGSFRADRGRGRSRGREGNNFKPRRREEGQVSSPSAPRTQPSGQQGNRLSSLVREDRTRSSDAEAEF